MLCHLALKITIMSNKIDQGNILSYIYLIKARGKSKHIFNVQVEEVFNFCSMIILSSKIKFWEWNNLMMPVNQPTRYLLRTHKTSQRKQIEEDKMSIWFKKYTFCRHETSYALNWMNEYFHHYLIIFSLFLSLHSIFSVPPCHA